MVQYEGSEEKNESGDTIPGRTRRLEIDGTTSSTPTESGRRPLVPLNSEDQSGSPWEEVSVSPSYNTVVRTSDPRGVQPVSQKSRLFEVPPTFPYIKYVGSTLIHL